jgi:hypothetical protein
MRCGWTAKQRVRVGPGRYRGRCRDAVTNCFAESNANSNRYGFCMRWSGNTDADANGDGYSDCGRLQLVGRPEHAYSAR